MSAAPDLLTLAFRARVQPFRGRDEWEEVAFTRQVPATETALLLCDVWDDHWCRAAARRVDEMAPRINEVAGALRARGAFIIHAPSDTMEFYLDHPARRRMQEFPAAKPPAPMELPDPPLPIDDSDGGCDSGETPWHKAWTRQHPAIEIRDADSISDDGREVYSALKTRGIELLLICGVHTNMC